MSDSLGVRGSALRIGMTYGTLVPGIFPSGSLPTNVYFHAPHIDGAERVSGLTSSGPRNATRPRPDSHVLVRVARQTLGRPVVVLTDPVHSAAGPKSNFAIFTR